MKSHALFHVWTQWLLGKGVAEVGEEPHPYNELKLGLVLEPLVGFRQ